MSGAYRYILAGLLSAAACGESSSNDSAGPGGAGGKADGIRTCEPGRNCLQFQSYEVLFTNPLCNTYRYDQPIEEVDGERMIAAKPKNVYCNSSHDRELQADRTTSPQFRILEWLSDVGAGDEVFLAYLSFSDQKVADALCDVIGKGAKVTFVLDKMSSRAEQVQACGGEILIRGHQGSVGFAHNKILMVNPREAGPADDDDTFVKLSFGSGNMSSGTHLHHENWHFIEAPRESFFVESHLCLLDTLIDPEGTNGKGVFRKAMNECRADITFEPEDDIIPFFIPVRDDSKALTALLLDHIDAAETIDIGAHRFSFTTMIEALKARLADAGRPFHMRLVADDDLYWLDPLPPSQFRELGPNTFPEAIKLRELRESDGDRGRFEEKYLETNNSLFLLHHNKFLIFEGMQGRRDALIVGSSNLTGTGFEGNLENMYFVDIPEVVDAFKAQFELFWDGEGPLPEGHDVAPQATMRDDMPVDILNPTEPSDPVDPPPPTGECGIRIAEVLYDAVGSDNGREWVKLYNSCDDVVTLDGMSLGWGGSSYTTGGFDLSGELGGKSCLIVGGATSDSSNGSPTIDLSTDLSPDLQNAGSIADGIAVFDDDERGVGTSTVPLDAVIYGTSNTSGLMDASGMPGQPNVGDAPAGQTIIRTGANSWDIGAPAPGDCPTF